MARAIFCTNADGVPFVEHEHNGVDPDERAPTRPRWPHRRPRRCAIEETQHVQLTVAAYIRVWVRCLSRS
jgi:hypothetical protein